MTPKQKHAQRFKSNWEEVNLENLLNDAPKMTISQIASRYRISHDTVTNYLKKYHVDFKDCKTGGLRTAGGKGSFEVRNPAVMVDACATIYPRHQHFQRAVV